MVILISYLSHYYDSKLRLLIISLQLVLRMLAGNSAS